MHFLPKPNFVLLVITFFSLFMAGNKVNNVDVVYTPWSNLKKTASMDVGQVGFHSSKMVCFYTWISCCFFFSYFFFFCSGWGIWVND